MSTYPNANRELVKLSLLAELLKDLEPIVDQYSRQNNSHEEYIRLIDAYRWVTEMIGDSCN